MNYSQAFQAIREAIESYPIQRKLFEFCKQENGKRADKRFMERLAAYMGVEFNKFQRHNYVVISTWISGKSLEFKLHEGEGCQKVDIDYIRSANVWCLSGADERNAEREYLLNNPEGINSVCRLVDSFNDMEAAKKKFKDLESGKLSGVGRMLEEIQVKNDYAARNSDE